MNLRDVRLVPMLLVLGAAVAPLAFAGDKPAGPPPGKDALVFDLGGDGLELSGTVTSKLLGDAPAKVHWTKAGGDDAFLVIDADGLAKAGFKVKRGGKQTVNGTVLFRGDLQVVSKRDEGKSNVQAIGGVWQALRDLDTNRDGSLGDDDPAWACLKAWVDKNGDGAIQPAELKALKDAGVKGITLPMGDPDASAKKDDAGNVHVDGEYAKADGKTGVVAAVTLAPVK